MRQTIQFTTIPGVVNYQAGPYQTAYSMRYIDPETEERKPVTFVADVPSPMNNYSGPPEEVYVRGNIFGIYPTPDKAYVLLIDVDV